MDGLINGGGAYIRVGLYPGGGLKPRGFKVGMKPEQVNLASLSIRVLFLGKK